MSVLIRLTNHWESSWLNRDRTCPYWVICKALNFVTFIADKGQCTCDHVLGTFIWKTKFLNFENILY